MSVNSSVNKQLEKMFDVFNKEFFDAELETLCLDLNRIVIRMEHLFLML